jgi:hypothetical protein
MPQTGLDAAITSTVSAAMMVAPDAAASAVVGVAVAAGAFSVLLTCAARRCWPRPQQRLIAGLSSGSCYIAIAVVSTAAAVAAIAVSTPVAAAAGAAWSQSLQGGRAAAVRWE